VRGKSFVRMRIKLAGADIPLDGGVELLRIRTYLQTQGIIVANTYGVSSKTGKLAIKAVQVVDALRCELGMI